MRNPGQTTRVLGSGDYSTLGDLSLLIWRRKPAWFRLAAASELVMSDDELEEFAVLTNRQRELIGM